MQKIYSKKEAGIPFTRDGYQKIREEKEKLLSERPEAVEHLRKSREMGDLSENGYYKASRARLSFLDSRLRRVDRLIKLGVIVESRASDTVDIGTRVTITDGKNRLEYTIVGGYESDPSKHTISYQSPLGKSLMGKKTDEIITVYAPSGPKSYTILSVN